MQFLPINYSTMFKRFISVGVASYPLYAYNATKFISFLDAEPVITPPTPTTPPPPTPPTLPKTPVVSTTAAITIDDDDKEDEAWELEKESCSFCRQFLKSPCKLQFRRWSKCVDKAKELDVEFVKACAMYTEGLLQCTSDNEAYFIKLQEQNQQEEDEEEEEEGSVENRNENKNSENIVVLEEEKIPAV